MVYETVSGYTVQIANGWQRGYTYIRNASNNWSGGWKLIPTNPFIDYWTMISITNISTSESIYSFYSNRKLSESGNNLISIGVMYNGELVASIIMPKSAFVGGTPVKVNCYFGSANHYIVVKYYSDTQYKAYTDNTDCKLVMYTYGLA